VDTDFPALAARIHSHLQKIASLQGQLLRINRGNLWRRSAHHPPRLAPPHSQ
jgi:hypothetical protein